ncbi:MAG TPA: ABC transporter permease [Pseudonocardia sp.]|nr:ABC transporter permease [Pseudonocardia sp.]
MSTRSSQTPAPATRTAGAPPVPDPPIPGAFATGMSRGAIELKILFRDKMELFFTLVFPVLLLVLLGSILGGQIGPDATRSLVTGIVTSGIFTVAFYGLTLRIGTERDDGTLRRLGATPLPKAAYFIGKTVYVVVAGIAETVVLVAVAVAVFGLRLPGSLDRWLTLAWVLALSAIAFTLLGIAFSSLVNARNGPVVVLPAYLVLQFISGVFFPFNSLPAWLQQIAAVFPLKWSVQGMQSAFLPDAAMARTPAGAWEHDRIALVLGAWIIGGLVLSLLTFRWSKAKS